MIYINVRTPAGREIFAAGDYTQPLGNAPLLLARQAGVHTFETLKAGIVDYRGSVDGENGDSIDLDLQPIMAVAGT